jgi:uncharacterized protein (TIGR02246 family)
MNDAHEIGGFARAECGIRQLHARCIDAVWRKDSAAFADCFAVDGEWIIAGVHARGRAQLVAVFDKFLGLNERVLMHFGAPILSLGDGSAVGRTHVSEDVKTVDGRGMKTIGIYHERLVLAGDRWLFAWRRFDMHYFGPPDLSGPFFDVPDQGPPPGPPVSGRPG